MRQEGPRRDLQRRGPRARAAAKVVEADYGAKWPKAIAKITDQLDALLEFYNYPAEHWIHPRTTNPIESTFATVRLRQRVTKGPGSRAAGVAMAFKLIESAQQRWRAVNPPHLVALAPDSRRANSSNDPPNQEVINERRDTRSTGLDSSSAVVIEKIRFAGGLKCALSVWALAAGG